MAERIIEVDTHVHTMLSGHSWSSLAECCAQAFKVGLKAICLTEHSNISPNGPPEWLPIIMKGLPEEYNGIRIYRGAEADILDTNGMLSPRDDYLSYLDFCIASIHFYSPVYGDEKKCTDALINVLPNRYVCALGHIDSPASPCDMEAVVKAAKQHDKLIEMNNSYIDSTRKLSAGKFTELLELCKRHDVRVCVGSDSHFHDSIGQFDLVCRHMEEQNFPMELVVNKNKVEFDAYIADRRKKIGSEFNFIA